MAPGTPLPISTDFQGVDEYVDSLLQFANTSKLFQTLCGGVHILDFFTRDPSLYNTVIPEEWKEWLMDCNSMELLDWLIRNDLETLHMKPTRVKPPPQGLIRYIKDIRRHSLQRSHNPRFPERQQPLPRQVSVGMIPKKIHEVSSFADYVAHLADEIVSESGREITHFIDFGSGQNYLGRVLASPPYNKRIIAVESKELNISSAKNMDVLARVAEREVVMRNKKLYRQKTDNMEPASLSKNRARLGAANLLKAAAEEYAADLRPSRELAAKYTATEGKGTIQYVEHVFKDGDLSNIVQKIEPVEEIPIVTSSIPVLDFISKSKTHPGNIYEEIERERDIPSNQTTKKPRLLAISIHSCGNLSHHGIRSLLLNPSVQAISIVGCCYNLVSERLGPPTYKLPILRPNLKPINARVAHESAARDPHGFPMSERIANFNGDGIRLNITARMMAVQAPQNWTEKESESFFTRHFFRALLQKLFLDRGVVAKPCSLSEPEADAESFQAGGTDPVIIGSLRKACYVSFTAYVRGAIAKLAADPARGAFIDGKMGDITDAEIDQYARTYAAQKKELKIMWSLMAFSAGVVESLIVVDRWLFLKEHPDVVQDAWVEAVFDYKLSPRNLVVVGIKRYDLTR